jgi:serine protease Do
MASRTHTRVGSILGLAVLALLLTTFIGSDLVTQPSFARSAAVVPSLAPIGPDPASGQLPLSGTFSPIVKEAAPAVVSIRVSKVLRGPQGHPDLPPFFGPPSRGPSGEAPQRRQQGAGSGVIISDEGYVVTNHHVIEGADDIELQLLDKRTFEAELIGTDAKTDIAVLRIDARGLPFLPLGNSENVQIGDIVLAIGNPFGIGQTVTMGIVGATGRGGLGIEDYEDFIQTDAAINPGNSGGALINARGELIGINTAILARGSGGNQGVGFAVPINLTHHVMTQLLEQGRVVRGFLGVGIQDMNPAMAEAFGSPDAQGVVVRSVGPGTPAAEAGLAQGDIILSVDGRRFDDVRELRLNIAQKAPGTTVRLAVLREGDERQIPVTLGESPDENARIVTDKRGSSALNGLAVDELTPAVARQLNLAPGTTGVVVVNVESGSAAADAGLRRGDVIEEVARTAVTDVTEFRAAVRKAGKGPLLLLVQRGGNPFYVVVEPR